MSRKVRRVPLDFDWPLNKVWHGYLMPDRFDEDPCADCKNGYSPHAQHLFDLWYGHTPFDPKWTGSTPLRPDTPAVRMFAERNVNRAPDFYGSGEGAIVGEAQRLARLWNGAWSHHISQEDVEALVAAGRLRDFTHTWDKENGWQEIEPPVIPTATQVNEWSLSEFGHDSINASVVIAARCERDDAHKVCQRCEGHGSTERYPGQRAEAEAWESTDPPDGDGWQLWETVSEGSPVTPVFSNADALVASLTGRAPARDAHALANLMRAIGLPEPALERTAAWLSSERRSSPRTQTGYTRDLSWWLAYLAARGLNPTDVSPHETDLYGAALRHAGLAEASRARRLAAASSWYAYLVRSGAATRNPFEGMERPRVAATSSTRGMSEDELERLLAYAAVRESDRTFALLALMVATGCRVSSVTSTTVGSLGRDRGHDTIDLPVKGGKTKRFVLPPFAADAIGLYLTSRGDVGSDAPLFVTKPRGRHPGGKSVDQPYVFRLVRRAAKAAGISAADVISPHSLRHSVTTLLLGKGYPLHVVQDFCGHADPRTTRRYDADRDSLDRSPAYDLGAMLATGVARHRAAYA